MAVKKLDKSKISFIETYHEKWGCRKEQCYNLREGSPDYEMVEIEESWTIELIIDWVEKEYEFDNESEYKEFLEMCK